MAVEDVRVGKHVCITGYGTSSGVHEREVIARLTKTMIVLSNGRRYRRSKSQESIPYQPYGGTGISGTCERPSGKKES